MTKWNSVKWQSKKRRGKKQYAVNRMLLNSNYCKVIKIAISSPYNFLCSIYYITACVLINDINRHQNSNQLQTIKKEKKKMLQLICLRKNLSIYLFHLLCSKSFISFFFEIWFTHVYVRRRIQLNIKCSTFEIIRKYEWHNCNFIVVLKIEMRQVIAWSQIKNYTDQKYNVFLSIWWLNFFFFLVIKLFHQNILNYSSDLGLKIHGPRDSWSKI